MKIEVIMTKDPVCCSPHDTVQHVSQLMKQYDVGALPVVGGGMSRYLVGMITDRDLCLSALVAGRNPGSTVIADYFSRNPVTCLADDPVEICEQKMKRYRIRRIPVVDSQNSCVGIVSQADLAHVSQPERIQTLLMEISRRNPWQAGPYRGVILGLVKADPVVTELPADSTQTQESEMN
jgi:CBS domain-containing protein